jgi:hypothetical protein
MASEPVRPIEVGDRAVVIVRLPFLIPDEPCHVAEHFDDGEHECWMISPDRRPHMKFAMPEGYFIVPERCASCDCYKAGEGHCDDCSLAVDHRYCNGGNRPPRCSTFGCNKADDVLGPYRGGDE